MERVYSHMKPPPPASLRSDQGIQCSLAYLLKIFVSCFSHQLLMTQGREGTVAFQAGNQAIKKDSKGNFINHLPQASNA